MQPTWKTSDDSIRLYLGDCLDVLRTMADSSVDSVVTDPPYGIGIARDGRIGGGTGGKGANEPERKFLEWTPKRLRMFVEMANSYFTGKARKRLGYK